MITTPTLDDFNRPDETPLGGNWSSTKVAEVPNNVTVDAPLGLQGGFAGGFALASFNASWYQAMTLPAGDCQVWGKVRSGPGSAERIGVMMHLNDPTSAANIDGYCALFISIAGEPNDPWSIWKVSNGSWTELNFEIPAVEVSPDENDFLLFDRVGSDLTFWHYDSSTDAWFDRVSATDSDFTGGFGALHTMGDEASFKGFGGGAERQARLQQIIRYR